MFETYFVSTQVYPQGTTNSLNTGPQGNLGLRPHTSHVENRTKPQDQEAAGSSVLRTLGFESPKFNVKSTMDILHIWKIARGLLGGSIVKNPPAMQETQV